MDLTVSDINEQLQCDVCGKIGDAKVFASSLGPASFAYCDECVTRGAEPLWMVATAIFKDGGLENFDSAGLSSIVTFSEGRYEDIDYVMNIYPQIEGDIRREFFGDAD